MNRRNYQQKLEQQIEEQKRTGSTPSLLLHCCCAPCSSYVLEYLSSHFAITAYFYNPNISPEPEYHKRTGELQRLLAEKPFPCPIGFIEGAYEPDRFFEASRGLERLPEGGERCFRCYELRLRETAIAAKEGGFDYFTTTLSISPYKNAEKLNELGGRIAGEVGVPYLFSDFKKKGGYQRSIALSKEYGLYRQDYCGCIFSKQEAERRQQAKADGEDSSQQRGATS